MTEFDIITRRKLEFRKKPWSLLYLYGMENHDVLCLYLDISE